MKKSNKLRVSTADFRKRYNFTQKQMSEKYGVPLRTVENWEMRQSCPLYVLTAFQRIEDLEERLAGQMEFPWVC